MLGSSFCSFEMPFIGSSPPTPFTPFPFGCDLFGEPPALLTSQHLTVQSAPPLTRRLDSALNAREYIDAVWPVIFFIRRPLPRSHRLIAKSSPTKRNTYYIRIITLEEVEIDIPAVASVLPSGLNAIVETMFWCPMKTRTQFPRCTSQRRAVRSLDPVARYSELGWNRTHCQKKKRHETGANIINKMRKRTSTSLR